MRALPGIGYVQPVNRLDDKNRDLAIRTLYGEAFTDPASQAAVAHVIKNRAEKAGTTVENVVKAKHQFEPWSSRKKELEAFDPNSPEYIKLGKVVDAVWAGETPDPTGGATLFYAPKTQKALGRKPPKWDTGKGTDIGQHRFFGGNFPTPKAAAPIVAGLGSPVNLGRSLGARAFRSPSPASPETPDFGGGIDLASLFSQGNADMAATAEAMEMAGIPEAHIAAVTGLSKTNGRWG